MSPISTVGSNLILRHALSYYCYICAKSLPKAKGYPDNNPRKLLATSSQDLKLSLEYLDHSLAQDIKKTGRISVESLSSSAL